MFGKNVLGANKWDKVESLLRSEPSKIFHPFNIHLPVLDHPGRLELGGAELKLMNLNIAKFERVCCRKDDLALELGAFYFSDEIIARKLQPVILNGLASHFHFGTLSKCLRFLPFPMRGGKEAIENITSGINGICIEVGDVIELRAFQ
jgi:hypothetical protein